MRKRLLLVLAAALLAAALNTHSARAGSTIIVDDNSDALSPTSGDGDCTLREALNNANGGADTTSGDCEAGTIGQDTITFAIGNGPQTISAAGGLIISDPLILDGSSQPGYPCSFGPCIRLDQGGGGFDLLTVSSPSTIRGLMLTGSGGGVSNLVLDTGSDGSTVQGNYIGTDGTNALSTSIGLNIHNTTNNLIGGTTSAGRNVISGAGGTVLMISGGTLTASGNTIQGNYIGLTADGTAMVPGSNVGIALNGGSGANTIGGSAPGAGNVIGAGNDEIALYTGGSGTIIQGNLIGTDAAGTSAISHPTGILLDTVSNVTIKNNLISGGTSNGIMSSSSGGSLPDHITIQGNKIGTDISGNTALPNSGNGIYADGTSFTIGGATAGAGNVISGNGGTAIYSLSPGVVIQGNRIGTNAAGSAVIPNASTNIQIDGGSAIIGGSTTPARNVISGSANNGIAITALATGATIQGNYIGTDATGKIDLGNTSTGIYVNNAPGVIIGGSHPGEGNLISGNDSWGVYVYFLGSSGTLVQGNRIGTNATGTAAIPNSTGITVDDAQSVVIGGAGAGDGNLVSGNLRAGVEMDAGTIASVVGNRIGSDENGTGSIPNGLGGLPPGGIVVKNGGRATITANLIAHQSGGSDMGINVMGASSLIEPGSVGNCLVGNTTGLSNTTGSGITFDNNWWNAASGPSGSGPGTGDPVSASVTFAPFLTAPPAACAYIYQTPPTLKALKAGQAVTKSKPKFTWKSLGKTETQYEIQIAAGDQPDFSNPLRDVLTLPKKLVYPSDLPLAYGTYYWRVRGVSGVLTPFSQPRMFIMTALKAPGNGKVLKRVTRPKFVWLKVPGAGTYALSVYASTDCSGSTFRSYSGLTKTNLPLPPADAMPPGVYSWRVAASNGAVMPCWSFTLTP